MDINSVKIGDEFKWKDLGQHDSEYSIDDTRTIAFVGGDRCVVCVVLDAFNKEKRENPDLRVQDIFTNRLKSD